MFRLFDPRYVAVAMAQPSQITDRLTAILDARCSRTRTTRQGALCLSAGVLMVLLPLAAVRVGARPPAATVSGTTRTANASEAETSPPSDLLTPDTPLQPQNAATERSEPELRAGSAPSGLIRTGELSAAPKSGLGAVAWGEVKDGLQAGLRIDTERRRFAVGEGLPLSFFLRNATKYDLAFIYTANPFDDQPRVEDEKGTSHHVLDVMPGGWPWAIAVVLKPGESLNGHQIKLTVGENRAKQPTPFPYFDSPTPGTYQISQSYRYKILTPKEVRDRLDRSDKKDNRVYVQPLDLFTKEGKPYKGRGALSGAFGELYQRRSPEEGVWSKPIAFEVVATVKEAAFVEGKPGGEQKASEIAWGKVANGLQTGIGFVEKRSRYNLGETMEVNVYVRNAGTRPTTFSWQSAPQFDHSTLIMPTMTGPKGKEYLFSGGEPIQKPTSMKTLQPGEMVLVSHSLIKLEPDQGNHLGFGLGPVAVIAPGKHRLRQAVDIKPEGASRMDLQLSSGELEFDAVSSVDRASWGATVAGLQAGLSFVGPRHRFTIGEMVEMDLYWRNASDHDIRVNYALFYAYDYMPTVFNAKGERMPLTHVAPMLLPMKREHVLKPGETVRIGSVNCVLAADTKRGKDVGMFPTLEAVPGKYRISQYTILQPDENRLNTASAGAIPASRAAPTTGELEFEVVEK